MNFLQRPKSLAHYKTEMRQKVPLLTRNQVRRFKIPFSDALIFELEEESSSEQACSIFKKIIDFDQRHERIFENKANNKLLEVIFDSLRELDKFDDKADGGEELVRLIRKLWNDIDPQLLEVLITESVNYLAAHQLEESKVAATINYLHGNLLNTHFKWHQAAIIPLEYSLSRAQNEDWQLDSEKLSLVAAQQLSDCLTKLANFKRIVERDIHSALSCSESALLVLRKFDTAGNSLLEIDAEIEYADCWLDANLYEKALSHYEHAMLIAEHCNLAEKRCFALIQIAVCYESLNDDENCERSLTNARKIASENSLYEHEGDVCLKLAQLCAVKDVNFQRVQEFFNRALDCFAQIQNQEKLFKAQLLFANISAKESFNEKIDEIIRANAEKLNVKFDGNKDIIQAYYDSQETTLIESAEHGGK